MKVQAVHEKSAPLITPAARKLGAKRPKAPATAPPPNTDRVTELRRLVGEHKRLTRTIQQWESSIKSRTLEDGSIIPPAVKSPAAIEDTKRAVATLKVDAADLVTAMGKQLSGIPIYDEFLSKVFGVGSGVLAAYLVSMIRIEKCPNVSQLIRYCGNACDNKTGRLERRHSAPKAQGGEGSFNDALRRNNYLIMSFMRQNAAKTSAVVGDVGARPSTRKLQWSGELAAAAE